MSSCFKGSRSVVKGRKIFKGEIRRSGYQPRRPFAREYSSIRGISRSHAGIPPRGFLRTCLEWRISVYPVITDKTRSSTDNSAGSGAADQSSIHARARSRARMELLNFQCKNFRLGFFINPACSRPSPGKVGSLLICLQR